MSSAEDTPIEKEEVTIEEDPSPIVKEEKEMSESPPPDVNVDVDVVPDEPAPVMPRYQYNREQLMVIKTYPLSQKRPDCLDATFNSSRGVWDPERWHLDRKRSETPPEEVGQATAPSGDSHKRRPGDPRERIRKEQDGIVLSPQRRSFNSGCFVTQTQPAAASRRPESPPGKADRDRGDASHREIPARRIGSGRILARERELWEFRSERDGNAEPPADFNSFQRGGGAVGSGRGDREPVERFERRGYGRDFGNGGEKERNRGSGRYGERRRYDRCEEEPEWFSAGPTSQHDTIELRGFDDQDDQPAGRKKPGVGAKAGPGAAKAPAITRVTLSRKSTDPPPPPPASKPNNGTTATTTTTTTTERKPSPPAPSSAATKENRPPSAPRSPVDTMPGEIEVVKPAPDKAWPNSDGGLAGDYNFLDDFLKGDALPNLLPNGAEVEGPGGSRFSRYFHRESPPNKPGSRRSSMQEEMLNNIINDYSDPTISIPLMGESEAYFAPISPAVNSPIIRPTPKATQDPQEKRNSLLEMLQRGQGDGSSAAPSIKSLEATGKIQSVEELEARMRQQGISNKPAQPQPAAPQTAKVPRKSDEELAAFKKLFVQSQGTNANAVPAAATNGGVGLQSQPINLMEMFTRPQPHGAGDGSANRANRAPASDQQAINLLAGYPNNAGHPNAAGNGPVPQPPVSAHQAQAPANPQVQVPQDLVMKLLQVQQQQQRHHQQQDMLNKLLAANQQKASVARMGFPAQPPPLSPLPIDVNQMIHGAQPTRDLLQRPEAQAILQGLKHGEITSQHLMQQLQNPAMQPRHRDLLVNILKMNAGGVPPAGVSPRATSPHVAPGQQPPPPVDLMQQIMMQQQSQQHAQSQLRIPSPNAAYCAPPPVISPNLATNPNTLSVQQHPGVPHRVPSPRELIVHTQNIMQSALIKKKLEEQRENFRKRQVQQSVSPNTMAMGNGPVKMGDAPPPQSKLVASPTPLAFTPTSVMRKMTAEKEPEQPAMGMPRGDLKLAMNAQAAFSMPPGGNQHRPPPQAAQLPLLAQLSRAQQQLNAQTMQLQQQVQQAQQQQQQQQQQGGSNWMPPTAKIPAGRPIVKGQSNFTSFSGGMDFPTPQTPILPPHRSMQHQQGGGIGYTGAPARPKMPMNNPPPNAMNPAINMMMYRSQNSQQQQQQNVNRGQKLDAQLALMQQQQQQQQQRQQHPSLQRMLHNPSYGGGSGNNEHAMRHQSQPMAIRQSQGMGMHGGGGDISTSPTSNQLAQWFSPELLAEAKAGRLQGMPAISTMQNILSLEELERLQQGSAAVHN